MRILSWVSDPVAMRKINGWLAVFFAVLIVPALLLGWLESVQFVSVLSLWALVASHWAGWQSARVEVRQIEIDERSEPVSS